jgi:excisionase family DNA binding protein
MKQFTNALKVADSRPVATPTEIMSQADACAFLAISRNTLYKLISEGEIPAFRLTKGGRWKFRRSDLEDWLADRKARSVR